MRGISGPLEPRREGVGWDSQLEVSDHENMRNLYSHSCVSFCMSLICGPINLSCYYDFQFYFDPFFLFKGPLQEDWACGTGFHFGGLRFIPVLSILQIGQVKTRCILNTWLLWTSATYSAFFVLFLVHWRTKVNSGQIFAWVERDIHHVLHSIEKMPHKGLRPLELTRSCQNDCS